MARSACTAASEFKPASLTSLRSNACKFVPEGSGRVRCSVMVAPWDRPVSNCNQTRSQSLDGGGTPATMSLSDLALLVRDAGSDGSRASLLGAESVRSTPCENGSPDLNSARAQPLQRARSAAGLHAMSQMPESSQRQLIALLEKHGIVQPQWCRLTIQVRWACVERLLTGLRNRAPDSAGGRLRLRVNSDNGVGIATEELDKAFQAFQLFRAGKLQELGGSGLGLSIGQQIAALHGAPPRVCPAHAHPR